jgi:glyoxylase-like metal-dependent hydrolase (beta-lactamase superfamily II)
LEVADGIHQIAVPTPFLVGRVNAYLLTGEQTVLFDTGPNSGTSLDELERALAMLSLSIESIDRLIITHQHVDHAGLASVVARRSGCSVEMIGILAPYLEDWTQNAAADDQFAAALMIEHGLDRGTVEAIKQVARAYRAFGSSVQTTVPLIPGETISINSRDFTIHHRPGHSPSDTIFHEETSGLLIGGDHLLPKVSSNPLISRGLPPQGGWGDSKAERTRALPDYISSMRETAKMKIDLILPGHGAAFRGARELVDERLAMHEKRAARLAGELENGPLSAFELSHRLWGDLAYAQSYLTLSEVIGHMDLLSDRGLVHEVEHGGAIGYCLT